MPTFTTNYNLAKPLVNNATDQDAWGGYVNGDMDIIDTQMKANADAVDTLEGIALLKATLVGMRGNFAMTTPPDEWLECNGQEVSRTTYALLFSRLGTTWGEGDGSTTFKLPDDRGLFLRGYDNGRGIDPDRVFEEEQMDAFQGHWHGAVINRWSGSSSGAATGAFGASLNSATSNSNIEARDAKTDGVNGEPRTAEETRSRNNAGLACIYAGVSTA